MHEPVTDHVLSQAARLSTAGAAAVVLILAGVGLGLAALFPRYRAGGASLASSNANLLFNGINFAGWVVAALLIATRRIGVGTWLAIGVTAASLGFYSLDTGSVVRYGSHIAGPGFWLGQANWLVCAGGTIVGVIAARQSSDLGAPHRRQAAFPLLAAIGGIAAAVAYAPGWDRYRLLNVSTGRHVDITSPNAFHNPGTVIAGHIAVLAVLAIGPVVATVWRPAALAAAALAGLLIPQIANLATEIVIATSPADPSSIGTTTQQLVANGATLTVRPTAWAWAEALAVGLLSLVCLARVLIPDPGDAQIPSKRAYRRSKIAPSPFTKI